ncbi:MAG: helix-turn-helix domain-containing protein [Bacteroidota bacterium]
MLFYPPGTTVQSSNPIGQPMEILLIRFPKNLLVQYMGDNQSLLENMTYSPIYEDLDYQTEQLIRKALRSSKSPFIQHASVLEILGIFFNKITNREHRKAVNKLHPEDVKALFLAASKLRDPLAKELPSVEVLASMAGMGITKFKQSFKQVFGTPPIRYHQKIKLEYAQNELLAKRKTASELSYELGYSHPSKFTVAYKKFFGTLPSQI